MPKTRRRSNGYSTRTATLGLSAKPTVSVINPESRMLPPDVVNITESVPTENTVIKWEREVRYNPISAIEDNSLFFEFFIPQSAQELIRPDGMRA